MHAMKVQIIHDPIDGQRTELGIHELSHMPPVGEPFTLDQHIYYTCKSYIGPDENDLYLLVLNGQPRPVN